MFWQLPTSTIVPPLPDTIRPGIVNLCELYRVDTDLRASWENLPQTEYELDPTSNLLQDVAEREEPASIRDLMSLGPTVDGKGTWESCQLSHENEHPPTPCADVAASALMACGRVRCIHLLLSTSNFAADFIVWSRHSAELSATAPKVGTSHSDPKMIRPLITLSPAGFNFLRPEHQKAHWGTHKKLCFAPNW